MRRIALWTAKGGTGKTTAALGLAAALGARGRRVLVVDTDPQASATRGLGVSPTVGLLDVLRESTYLVELVLTETVAKGVSLVPGSPELAAAERALAGEAGAETLYRQALDELAEDSWDYLLTDCPPGVSVLSVGALVASQSHVAPIDPAPYAVAGLAGSLDLVEKMRKRLNPQLEPTRILLSRVPRTRAARLTCEGLRDRFGELVFAVSIPERVAVVEASAARQSILDYAPDSPVAEAFTALAAEIDGGTI